jgi:uncharacterized membrane protein YkvA (DUF1232 family)
MKKFMEFLTDLAEDDRIPIQNRIVLGGLILYLLTPVDIIPDFIPLVGWLDDAFVTLIVLDYIFNSADTELILEHYPWNKKNFNKVRAYAQRLSFLIPPSVKNFLFKHAAELSIKAKKKQELKTRIEE